MAGNGPKCEPSEGDGDGSGQPSSTYSYVKALPENEIRPVHQSYRYVNHNASSILHHLHDAPSLEELTPAPAAPAATPVAQARHDPPDAASLEPLTAVHSGSLSMQQRLADCAPGDDFLPLFAVKDELSSEGEPPQLSGVEAGAGAGECEARSEAGGEAGGEARSEARGEAGAGRGKAWAPQDMEAALEALRSGSMSLTKASSTFGIPSTTLWQRAHRGGITTPKRDGAAGRAWRDADLRDALRALRAGAISANKASKAYGIPSSTLYKIARREGIRLAAPFNAAPTPWRRADLTRALQAIRAGGSVQGASQQYGIPTGTLYGRCKREGIGLSRASPAPWSERAMSEALDAVRVGQMSINQAAIHYNLPYSSLYGRFKRCQLPELSEGQPPPYEPQDAAEVHNPEAVYYEYYGPAGYAWPAGPDPG